MKLKCDCREVDNVVIIDGSKYHFVRAHSAAAMLCEVNDEAHAAAILRDPIFSVSHANDLPDDDELKIPHLGLDEDDPDFGANVDDGTLVSEEKVVAAEVKYENMTMEELVVIYAQRFGRAAPPQIKHETLVRKLAEFDAKAP